MWKIYGYETLNNRVNVYLYLVFIIKINMNKDYSI
jgi:hypothetical protein